MKDPLPMATEPPRRLPAIDYEGYLGPSWWSLGQLRGVAKSPGMRRLALLWLVVNAVSILMGVLNVALGWNGIPVALGEVRFEVTLYPPLPLSVLCAVWLGPGWGIVPAYLANVASALYRGIDWPTSAFFALAGAIETAILWGSMVTLNISPDLRRRRDLARFVAAAIVAPTTSSTAVIIWNTALGLDFLAGQRIWRGWVLGDFLQTLLVIAPCLRWLGGPVRGWIDRQFATSPRFEFTYTRIAVLVVAIFSLMGVLVFAGVGMLQASLDIDPGIRTAGGELLRERLFEIQFFLGVLVVALMVATGVFSTALARMSERHRSQARRESLTGCFNRRAFYELFQRETDRSRRLGQGLSLVFLDLDHFKRVNDRLGHEAGDRLLQQLAVRMQSVIRETDLLFRWGGEEFVMLLPHTSPADAPSLAERVRAAVAERPFLDNEDYPPVRITVSLGTAGTIEHPVDADALLARADAACYRAKAGGRDRVEAESGPGAAAWRSA